MFGYRLHWISTEVMQRRTIDPSYSKIIMLSSLAYFFLQKNTEHVFGSSTAHRTRTTLAESGTHPISPLFLTRKLSMTPPPQVIPPDDRSRKHVKRHGEAQQMRGAGQHRDRHGRQEKIVECWKRLAAEDRPTSTGKVRY